MQAVALRPKEWLRLTESGTDGHLVAPIMVHLLDDNGNSVMGIPQEELDQVLAEAADPRCFSSLCDHSCRAGRKTLVRRSDSGDFHVSQHATWGMSAQT